MRSTSSQGKRLALARTSRCEIWRSSAFLWKGNLWAPLLIASWATNLLVRGQLSDGQEGRRAKQLGGPQSLSAEHLPRQWEGAAEGQQLS